MSCPSVTFPKNGISNSVGGLVLVEESVVFGVDEELTGSAVWNTGSRHRDRVLHVLQTIG